MASTPAAFSSGSITILGAGDEGASPGVAVAPSHFIPQLPGQTSLTFDPGRQDAEVASGNPEVVIGWYDSQGKLNWRYTERLYPTLGLDVDGLWGFASTGVLASKSITLTESYGSVEEGGQIAVQYPGCRHEQTVLLSNPSNGVTLARSGRGTARPIVIGALPKPAMASEDGYAHAGMGPATLIGGYIEAFACNEARITIDTPHAGGQGNAGVPLENILRHDTTMGSFQLKLFLNEQNIVEWNAFIAPGGTEGPLQLTWTSPDKAHTMTVKMPKAKYRSGPIQAARGQLTAVTLSGTCKRPDNATPMLTWSRT